MTFPDIVKLATPVLLAFIIIEMIVARWRGRGDFEARDTAASLLVGLGSLALGGVFAFVFIDVSRVLASFRPAGIGESWGALALCFVIDDLGYYGWHRLSHRVRWFWADHVPHHSSQHFNLSVVFRQAWTSALTPILIIRAPLLLLGFPLPTIVFTGGVVAVYQFWIHTETIERMPRWFEAVFNTPSHHRVHHATNPRYLDSNYAGVLIVWDRLFGTFVPEDPADPPRYGIVRNLGTFNPLRIALHEWVQIGLDIVRARSLTEFVCYLFAPPGWSPDGSRDTTDTIKARWRATEEARSSGR
ncbi:MAG: sterol desaturase family protein [Sulfurifustaceae bacterium]